MDNFFNENNFKIWSKIGSRATFGLAALQLAKINENLIGVGRQIKTRSEPAISFRVVDSGTHLSSSIS